MTDLSALLRASVENADLIELTLRRTLGGWQALAVYRQAASGPWGVGCSDDPIAACEKALRAEVDFSRAERGWQAPSDAATSEDEEDIFA